MCLTATQLFHGDLLAVHHVRCRPDDGRPSPIEHSEADTLVLPLRGVFAKHVAPGRQQVAEPTQCVFFAAARPYRISHPDGAGDDCLVLQFSPPTLAEALADVAAVDTLCAPGLRIRSTLPPAALASRTLLARRLAAGRAGPLEVEETSVALLASILASALREERRGARTRSASRAARGEQADAVRAILRDAPDVKWTLPALARQVHASPFHLARIFREDTGVSVHAYQLRVRLSKSIDLLLDTGQTLSEIAHRLGFATHSHFTSAFRRMTGLTPGRFRGTAGGERVREVRTILIERLRRAP